MIIVTVVLPYSIRQNFKYFLPNYMYPIIGGRILVPFNSKDTVGIVIDFYKTNNVSQLNLKYVKSLIDTKSLYNKIVLDILIWISKNYHCPVGYLLFSVLPKCLRTDYILKDIVVLKWNITKKGQELDLNYLKNRKKQLNALQILKKTSILDTELKQYNLSKFILKKLENQKLCQINSICLKNQYNFKMKKKFFLNKKILIVINDILNKKCFKSWLLTNITLYIKVKFYLGLIKKVLHKNMQILILVPYIKNINMIVIFLKKFFDVSINVCHAKLTSRQYLKVWLDIKNSKNSIVIGTNKSIFLPFLNLGLIIVLEEHHLKYKNKNQFRYHVRDLGIFRAYKTNIPIILDSNTPSLKTLYNILNKKCFYVNLNQYYTINRQNYNIINLKKEKIKFRLSLTLIHQIYKNFKNKQVLLIFNKFSLLFFILTCNKCSWIFTCSLCREYIEIKKYYNILFCTFCLIQLEKPKFCYVCGSVSLIIKNINLEEVKNKIKNIFSNIPLLFLFNESKIYKNISNKNNFKISLPNPYIIISTEEIVENYYFPNVQLISLICIDHHYLSFHLHSIEYFAQFYMNLNQLTRFKKESLKIFMQTSLSDNFHLKDIYNNRYHNFSNILLSIRKKFFLPPWSFHSVIYSESIDAEYNIAFLNLIRKILQKQSNKYNIFLWFIGPDHSMRLTNKNIFCNQLLIECSSRSILNYLLNISIDIVNIFTISKRVKWFIDIEPN
ncbi:replication restart helicase PriA [Buchnera aphidicola]|uniref:Replication restart protein PriA n=1 Tax=Buchnera aphidicola str. Ua (Uroleucon ambrosiae) TaxID=1005057 RepID=G2LNZ7_BUCUM|nr:primosomal protein N' [Buchnera aphidicola]AEO07934.1 primosomal protein N' [Buchnera aphidicola str. Ua (Uroleucon ambrosiae)]